MAAPSSFAADLRSDERVLFYPTLGGHDAVTGGWRIPVHALVFEPERRALTAAALRTALGLVAEPKDAAERKMFESRARAFLVDNERGKPISVRVGERNFFIGESAADGHVRGEFRLPNADAKPVTFTAVTRAGDAREFRGTAHLLADTGVSVISDVDDTIKVSHVRDRQALLRKTFYEPFQAVEGMAAVYRAWAADGASFHYVSASPWQLYEPITKFTAASGFPAGSWHMKQFRVKDSSFLALFDSPEACKPGVIEPMLRQFPKRRFILVGDSGERDPEIYGALARQFPQQVHRILIRDVTEESAAAARYQAAFKDVPREKWRVFQKPEEISEAGLGSLTPAEAERRRPGQ
ncbi:MAG: App1 family protein [Verrucomicrobia bacterium]|nr:App1 family protein [Verrucomicrobiota bacterium]